jgi:Ca2+-binding RTX toxin-like protein
MCGTNIEKLVFIRTTVIDGGVSADIMIGGTGRDVLTSDAGIDRFNYNNVNGSISLQF